MAGPVIEKRSTRRQELCDKVSKLHDTLSKKLDDENKKLLEELLNTVYDDNYCYSKEIFARGFSLAASICFEIFSEQDMLLNENE